jgi:hypothetical protein
MTQDSNKGFELPNSTVALLLVLTIVFMVWSFAVVSTSISSPGAAQVTGESGPSSGAIGFYFGERPQINADKPIQSGTARLEVVPPQGEAQ